ncbi:MAG: hypothetical protein AAFX99_07380, partial [Myxococcota bacterium]
MDEWEAPLPLEAASRRLLNSSDDVAVLRFVEEVSSGGLGSLWRALSFMEVSVSRKADECWPVLFVVSSGPA